MSTALPAHTKTDAERDLEMAGTLQRMLLPRSALHIGGWSIAHRYEPAGAVSGDYVGLQRHGERLYFMLGDVSGKGVAASLLMAQLHAMFRTLIPLNLSLDELMTRASALLCASSLPAQYATMVGGYLEPSGNVVISNAGHPPPLVISGDHHADVRATGVPMGLFCESRFSSTQFVLQPGETFFAFTDGLHEATNLAGEEYGLTRVEDAARRYASQAPGSFIDAVRADQDRFREGRANTDDMTLLAIRRG